MFEIGSSLREARLRQGLDFPELEQATKIRGKYLRALEDEQFDVLPAKTYVKGFLRNYAEFLGLDGQLYVDEYNSRYVVGDDEPLSRPRRSQPVRRGPRVQSRVVLLTLLGIALVAGLVIVAWKNTDSNKPAIPGLSTMQTSSVTTTPTVARSTPHVPTVARLEVTATLDASWLQVHRTGPTGPVVYQGTLEKGERQVFVARRLWIDVGRPEVLRARLNGRVVRLPTGGPKVLVVTARGVRVATGA
jgi:cytoskeleton protein RodZ